MRLLVTGASGFLGLRFCQILQERGVKVRALVRSQESALKLQDIAEVKLLPQPWSREALLPVCSGITAIIHLVGRAHIINDKAKDPEALFYEINVELTRQLLRAAAGAGVVKFLYVSSVQATAFASERILKEDDACRPLTPYGRSKLEAEAVVKDLAAQASLQYMILRLPLVYGPGNRANMLRLFHLVDKAWPLPLGAIANRRSFIYIDNAVEAALAALECPAAGGETFFVSDGEPLSTPELIRAIAKSLGRPARLIPVPPCFLRLLGRLGDCLEKISSLSLPVNSEVVTRLLGSLAVDSRKIRQVTGWLPRYRLSEGLKATAAWYLKAKNTPSP